MAKPKTNSEALEIQILKLNAGRIKFRIYGETPLIYSAMSLKVKESLLAPRKKTIAERAATVKHDPLMEYRSSVYRSDEGPTLLVFPAVAFKRALASSALDLGGAKKAQVERLVWAIGQSVPVWGVPQLRMDVVRSADQNHTPDIRTRACLPRWCAELTLAYVKPVLNDTVVANLLAAAGMIRGIGDYRQEKGAGNYGQFTLDVADKDFDAIVKTGGRKEQEAALAKPECFDDESYALLTWWEGEIKRRGQHTGRAEEADDDEEGVIDAQPQ